MLERLNIERVNVTDKSQDGEPLINKFGKPYVRVGLRAKQYGAEWLNGIMSSAPTDWEGKEVELEVFEEEYAGKVRKKFKLPSKPNGGGMSDADRDLIVKALTASQVAAAEAQACKRLIVELAQRLKASGVIRDREDH